MGHDIIAYKNYKDQDEEYRYEEIAYLRYNMSNDNSLIPYALLDSLNCHCGCSGNGEDKEYSLEEIKTAIKNLEKVKEFFSKIEKEFEKEKLEKITIGWY